eukprot:m.39625 g.39625  ORF g.39625 m.39625 type:complete len:531 (-) comp11627_c0_seq1:765-2357(-)
MGYPILFSRLHAPSQAAVLMHHPSSLPFQPSILPSGPLHIKTKKKTNQREVRMARAISLLATCLVAVACAAVARSESIVLPSSTTEPLVTTIITDDVTTTMAALSLEFPVLPLPLHISLRLHATDDGWLASHQPTTTAGDISVTNYTLRDPPSISNSPSGAVIREIIPLVQYGDASEQQTWPVSASHLSAYIIAELRQGAQIQFGTQCPDLFRLSVSEDGLIVLDTCTTADDAAQVQETSQVTDLPAAPGLTFLAIVYNEPSQSVAVYINSTFATHILPHVGGPAFHSFTLSGPLRVSDAILYNMPFQEALVNAMNIHFWTLLNSGPPANALHLYSEIPGSEDAEHASLDEEYDFSGDDGDFSDGQNGDDQVDSTLWYTCVGGVSSRAQEFCQCKYGCVKCLLPPASSTQSEVCLLCSSSQFILDKGTCLTECPPGYELILAGTIKSCQRAEPEPTTVANNGDLVGNAGTNDAKSSSGFALTGGTIAGLAVGVMALAVVVALVIVVVSRRKHDQRAAKLLEQRFIDDEYH